MYLLKKLIYIPDTCPICHKSNIKIGIYNKLLNPFRLICNNYKCKYRGTIRKYSCLKIFLKISGTIFFKILFKFIIEEKNGTKIKSYLETSENIYLNYPTITKILIWIPRSMAHYLKDYYRFNKLGRRNGGSLISMDESNFIDIDSIKLWIIGAKNNITNNIRIDVFNTRIEEDVKLFIYNHIKPQNTIITDGWLFYNFLNNNECPYLHEVHVHGPNGNFGYGSHSTRIIEGAWGILQNYIKRIYGAIPGKNFILYLREAEFRFMLSKYSNSEKENKIIEIFKYMYNSSDYELYDDDELLDNNNYDY